MTARMIIDELTEMINNGLIDENAEVEFDLETGVTIETASVDDVSADDSKAVFGGYFKRMLGDDDT